LTTLVFLLEEPSMKEALQGLLPRILPDGVHFICVPHEGKSDLERSIPRKLRGWKTPDTCFVIVRDQDAADCHDVKDRLVELCQEGHRPDSLVRVVCRELESWFLGDLEAVEEAHGVNVARLQGRRKYRNPDTVGNPAAEMARLVPGYQKVAGARAIGPRLDPARNRSPSFRAFVDGVRRLADQGCAA
jgi:hypothetical protein